MARVLDSGELAALRKDNQTTELYVAFLMPDTVYSARVNGLPSSNDELASIVFDGGSGTPGDTRAAMSVLVGSSAGAYDKGSVRLREAISAASGTMKLGEMSDVDWADDDHLTIVREFLLRPRHLRIDSAGTVFQDYDIEFTDPTYNPHLYPAPIPIIGTHACVWLDEQLGTADILFDASESYTVGGAGTMTYAWTVEPSGTASFDNAAIAAPTLTVTAADTYTVQCVVTWTYTAGGQAVSTTSYRHVFAFDKDNLPMKVFQLGNCSGVFSSGGYSFSITAYDEAQRSEIRDRTLCVLFAKDRYGPLDTDETSIGPLLSGATPIRENIIACGWIVGESIEWNPEQGMVGFEVQGPHRWLGLMEGFPSGIEDTSSTPDAWTNTNDLTPRSGTALFWLWRSTGPQVMDAFIFPDSVIDSGASPAALSEGSEREFAIYDAPPMPLWRQISSAVFDAVRAHITCDRYGRLFVQRNLNEILEADRTAGNAPTVMELTKADWHQSISIDRRTISPVSQLDISGVAYHAGAASALFSLSPGHIFKQYGGIQRSERLALWAGSNSQELSNAFCGLILGNMNNEYPVISTALASNNRAFDIAPWQYATLIIAEGDTERGISGTFTLLPRRVSFRHDPRTGILLTNVEFESEGIPVDGITGDPPPEPPGIPTAPPVIPPLPPEPEPEIETETAVLMASESQIVVTFDITADSPVWYDADPNGDITGTPWNGIAFDDKAYVVTRGALYGIWYCDDITAAIDGTITWTKEIERVADDLGPMQVVDDEPFIVVETDPAAGYNGEWGSLIELKSLEYPILRGDEFCDSDPPPNSCTPVRSSNYTGLRGITPDGTIAGNQFRSPTHYGFNFPLYDLTFVHVCNCGEGSASRADAGFRAISQSERYLINDANEVKDSNTGTTTGRDGTWPEVVLDTGVTADPGIVEDDVGRWYYIKGGDLHRNAAEFASSTEFDLVDPPTARNGWFFQFLENGDMVWMISNGVTSWTTHHHLIVLYDAETRTWAGKNGDLAAVLGTTTWDKSTFEWAWEIPEDLLPA